MIFTSHFIQQNIQTTQKRIHTHKKRKRLSSANLRLQELQKELVEINSNPVEAEKRDEIVANLMQATGLRLLNMGNLEPYSSYLRALLPHGNDSTVVNPNFKALMDQLQQESCYGRLPLKPPPFCAPPPPQTNKQTNLLEVMTIFGVTFCAEPAANLYIAKQRLENHERDMIQTVEFASNIVQIEHKHSHSAAVQKALDFEREFVTLLNRGTMLKAALVSPVSCMNSHTQP